MGWEKGGRYYTRSRRENGRVVREYVGTGILAQLSAEWDELEREALRQERHAWVRARKRVLALEASAAELGRLCSSLLRAAFMEAGYNQHDRGDWRKRRG